ncbi:sulfite exporter TauE/SafE family protein [Maridesulfovibrio zosterae]|uniref:sulfite exporter TauE/SafE family protein n=1 Tax=Maridesulfovibrio zosterae TaxID=82171 RepID=UPI000418B300|nr:sulfite exporter TauE/SafE family protein [Maridesulfovibrio zosterae]
MSPFLIVPAIFTIAGIMQGLTGFGCALIAMPLLAFVIDIKVAVPTCTLCAVFININMTHNLRNNLDRSKILPLIIGSIPGTILGLMIIKEVNGNYIRLFLGLLIATFASYSLLTKPVTLKISNRWGYFSGFLTGLLSATVSAGGPPTIIYSSLKDWGKDCFRATLVSFFLVAGLMAAAGHLICGLTTMFVFKLSLASTLPIVFGTYIGCKLSSTISEGHYKRIVMILLVFMGLMLIFQNV